LSEKIDVLQVFYDRSPIGIVAAVPIMDGQNKTDDARILTMNARRGTFSGRRSRTSRCIRSAK
jgi:hypothetical protein